MSLRALFIASALLVCSAAAHAAGLGKLTVLSNLGQPLHAEIDVVAVEKGERDSLNAKLATVDAYLQNNLPYPPPSLGLKLSLEQRPSGETYIRVSSALPVNEPFVDILVELTWNGGRILRAYTALLDPPPVYATEEPKPAAPAAAAAPQVQAAPPAPAEPPVQTKMGTEMEPKEPAPAPPVQAETPAATETPAPSESVPPQPEVAAAAPAAPSSTEAPAEAGMPKAPAVTETKADTYGPVKKGDTLTKIAEKYKAEDVTLDQMLVVLFKTNKDAFIANNMNRLKTGKVLQVPGSAELSAMDPKAARKEVHAQIVDYNAYREKIAAAAGMAAPSSEQAGQAAGGKVSGIAPEKAAPGQAQPKEVLKLSKGESPGGPGGAASQERIRSLEEDVAAREKTIKEQNERVAKLEKTIKDMQALLEIKNKGMAELAKPGTSTPPAAVPAPAHKPEPMKPETPATAVAPATTPSPAPVAAPPAEALGGPSAASGTAAVAKPKPKKPTIPPLPPKQEESIIDQIMEEPIYLAGGAAVLALLGFLGFRFARNRRAANNDGPVAAEKKTSEVAAFTGTSTDTSGGVAAAARAAAGAQVTEEVDPLAEAEIYLAYGRDAQAEEILKEALNTHPRRYEIHLKLLEIYAKRKDLAAFDPVARELQVSTGGQGEVWLQAARLGYQLDSGNSRYLSGKPSGAETAAAAAAAAAAASPLEERLDFNIGLDDADVGTKTDIDLSRLGGAGGGTTTDIDLSDMGGPSVPATADIDLSTMSSVAERAAEMGDVDLPIDISAVPEPTAEAPSAGGLDFDFDLNSLSGPTAETSTQTSTHTVTKAMTQTVADVGEPGMGTIEFDLSKISLDAGGPGKTEPRLGLGDAPAMPDIDLSGISLDLGGESQPAAGGGGEGKDDRWYDVQTKFDLAKAYQEMGDKEGAREILREVIAEGDGEQKAAAQRVLETLS
jgi:pilus assembly protein FimV